MFRAATRRSGWSLLKVAKHSSVHFSARPTYKWSSYHDHNKSDWENEWKGRPGGKKVVLKSFNVPYALVAVNVLVALLIGDSKELKNSLGLSLKNLNDGRLQTLITSMFVHSNLMHLFFNCVGLLSLAPFGTIIGARRFLAMYMFSGLVSSLAITAWHSMLYSRSNSRSERLSISRMTTVGASGALFGAFAYTAMAFPSTKVYVFFVIPAYARTALLGALLFEGIRLYENYLPHISAIGHLGGMAGGFMFFMLRRLRK